MKKWFLFFTAVIISILITAFGLCGCGSSGPSTDADGHTHEYKKHVCTVCYEIDPDAPDTKDLLYAEVEIDGVSGYSVNGLPDGRTDYIKVPESHNGKPVIALSVFAFSSYGGTSIYIPDSVTTIGYDSTGFSVRYVDVFDNCPELVSVSLPNSLKSVGMSFVHDCPKLKYNEYGNGLYLGNAENPYVVLIKAKSTDITSIAVHEDTKIIADFVTEDCFDLSGSVTIPAGTVQVGYYAFSYCPGLTIYCEAKKRPSAWDEDWHTYGKTLVQGYPSVNSEFIDLSAEVVWNCFNNDKDEDGYAHTTIDGIHYALKGGKATVAHQPLNTRGDIVLPHSIEHDGDTYTVSAICEAAFMDCTMLTSVRIPYSVVDIDKYVFSACRGVTVYCEQGERPSGYSQSFVSTVDLDRGCPPVPVVYDCNHNKVDKDGYEYAVIGDMRYKLKDGKAIFARKHNERNSDPFSGTVVIPETVLHNHAEYTVVGIDDFVFENCKELTEVKLSDSVTAIGADAFYDCEALKVIALGAVTELGEGAFGYCKNLIEVELGALSKLSSYAFVGCTSLERVALSGALIDIGDWAFVGCAKFSRIDFDGAWWKWRNVRKSSGWHDSKTPVTVYCKDGTGDLNNVFTPYPDYVCTHEWHEWQFAGFDAHRHVRYCENCDEIQHEDCEYDDGAITVEPDCENDGTKVYTCSVCGGKTHEKIDMLGHDWGDYTYVNENAHVCSCSACNKSRPFRHEYSVLNHDEDGHILECEECKHSISVAHEFTDNECTVCGYTREAEMQFVLEQDEDGNYTITGLRDGITAIDLVIPSSYNGISITAVSNGAFMDCSSITSLTVAGDLDIIDENAFADCINLRTVTVTGSVKTVGYTAFRDCTALTEVTLLGAERIDFGAFAFCGNLKTVTLTENLVHIGDSAFNECTSLSSIKIPNSVTSLGEEIFRNCSSLKSVELGSGISGVGAFVFRKCTGLQSITIPSTVTSIGDGAFQDCKNLERVTMSKSVTEIGRYAFASCSKLARIEFDGTIDEWNAVSKNNDEKWDMESGNYTVYCSNGNVSKNS